MKTVRTVLVDIDSILYAMVPVLAKYCKQLHGISFAPAAYDDWDYWKKLGLTLPQWLAVIDAGHDPAQVLANAPFPGAVPALKAWAARGVRLHIVSDRKPESFDATRTWLDKIGVPKANSLGQRTIVHLAPRVDKVAYAREHGIDLLIDDKPSLISACRTADPALPIATLLYKYNRAQAMAPGVIRATNWADLRKRIEAAHTMGG